jgi:hypothetical protein
VLGGHVYFAGACPGKDAPGGLCRVSVEGGQPELVLPRGPYALVAEGRDLYFGRSGDPDPAGRIVRLTVDEAGASTLTELTRIDAGPDDIAVVGSDVVWGASTSDGHHLASVPKTGGQPVLRAAGRDDVTIRGVGGHGDRLHNATDCCVFALPKTGQDGATPLVKTSSIVSFAVDGDGLYWVTERAVYRASLAGTPVTQLALTGSPGGQIAVAGDDVFWLERGTRRRDTPEPILDHGRVLRVAKAGGAVHAVLVERSNLAGFVVAGDDVFAIEHRTTDSGLSDGKLVRARFR